MFKKNSNKKRRAFTLLELIIVVAIIALLVAIALPRFTASRQEAAITAHSANVRVLKSAAATYLASEGGEVTWTAANAGDNQYVEEWPSVPKNLPGVSQDEYQVNIGSDGTITVSPDIDDVNTEN